MEEQSPWDKALMQEMETGLQGTFRNMRLRSPGHVFVAKYCKEDDIRDRHSKHWVNIYQIDDDQHQLLRWRVEPHVEAEGPRPAQVLVLEPAEVGEFPKREGYHAREVRWNGAVGAEFNAQIISLTERLLPAYEKAVVPGSLPAQPMGALVRTSAPPPVEPYETGAGPGDGPPVDIEQFERMFRL